MKFLEIKLFTHCLKEQRNFYHQVLGLPLVKNDDQSFGVAVGSTLLSFRSGNEKSYYHFAFTVPNNAFSESKNWISSYVPLNTVEGSNEIYFKNWDAHACYFYDPAGNVVELIARHTIDHFIDHPFTSRDILAISEIGMPVKDVREAAGQLRAALNTGTYHGENETFAPLGNEDGLLIVSDDSRNWLGSNKAAKIFPMEIVLDSPAAASQLDGYPYKFSSKKASASG
ncbi:VOC family protein [Fictibacillus terranigra]|uniref:Ring-cleaving dioxygenase n=1 Tax=Fictibacillus terranigra TaxID=3058424 RepID=A0ABT8E7M1_9BACL|nr:ring-cleaving dioxygenase [Fictibacillus sp. CENA-BCM004]MDN4073922.1 ring-cleaving dioxygenase [Fictibacillus sp. CENA-BCM004]